MPCYSKVEWRKARVPASNLAKAICGSGAFQRNIFWKESRRQVIDWALSQTHCTQHMKAHELPSRKGAVSELLNAYLHVWVRAHTKISWDCYANFAFRSMRSDMPRQNKLPCGDPCGTKSLWLDAVPESKRCINSIWEEKQTSQLSH